jgi:hypothetical protein
MLVALFCLVPLVRPNPVQAHDIRPAYLEITEGPSGDLRILWREPIAGEYALPLAPEISTGWLRGAPITSSSTDTVSLRVWRVPAPHVPLAGATVSIGGLDSTITDVLLRVRYRDGTELTRLLTPTAPRLQIPSPEKVGLPVREYVELGVTHIWGGIDHLLYVFGLVLLVPSLRTLLKTITGFTVAHSITLAAASLGYVHIPPAPVEAVIALSIVFVAAEVLKVGEATLSKAAPWAIAFAFGLLHGLGFAGALAEIGLPPHAIPLALFLFNVGIEIGQLTFVAALLLAATALYRLVPRWVERLQWLPPHLIGGLASFWLIERVLIAI